MDVHVDAAAADVLAEQARVVRFLQRLFAVLERLVMEFAAQIVVGDASNPSRSRRSPCLRCTACGLKRRMSRSLQVPGSDSSELHKIYFCIVPFGMKLPLQAGREAGAAAAAQRALLQFVDDRRRVGLLGEDLLPRLVAVDLQIAVQRPRLSKCSVV